MAMSEIFSELDPKVAQALGRAVEKLRDDLQREIDAGAEAPAASSATSGSDSLEELRHAVARVDRATNQTEALSALLEGACRFSSRAALFTVRGDGLEGWDGRGFEGATRAIAGQELASPNGSLTAKLTSARGLMALSAADCTPLCEALGVGAPAVGALIPLQLGERVAAGLYVDRLEGGDSLDLSALQLLTYCAGQVLETLPLRGRAATATLRIAGDSAPAAPPAAEPPAPQPSAEPTAAAAVEETPTAAEPAPAPEERAAAAPQPAAPPADEPAEESPAAAAEAAPAPEPREPAATEPTPPAIPEPAPEEPAAVETAPPAAAPSEPEPQQPPSAEAAPQAPAAAEPPPSEASEAAAEEDARAEGDTAAVFHDPSFEETAPSEPETDASAPAPGEEAAEPEPQAAASPGLGFDVTTGHAPSEPARPAAPQPPADPAPAIDKSSTLVQPPDDLDGPGWAFTTQKISTDLGNEARVEEARRLARLLVTEIKLYNEDQVEAGRRHNDLYQRLKEDIERSRQIFEDRIDDEVRTTHDFFGEAMIKILAGGNAASLGT